MTLNIYLREEYIFKKVWSFLTRRKLPPAEEVFGMTMSRSSARTATPFESCVVGKDKRDKGLGRFLRKYSSLISSFLVDGWVDWLVVCLLALLVVWLVGSLLFG
jgi:hypothetical protein